jgi:hypothetical protein
MIPVWAGSALRSGSAATIQKAGTVTGAKSLRMDTQGAAAATGVALKRSLRWELAIGIGKNGDRKESTSRVEEAIGKPPPRHFERLHF